MNADEVARWLQANPMFFEEYSQILSQVQVPSPHGGKAIALSDRQVLSLRETNRKLEAKLADLVQFGEENDAISAKVHRLSLALLSARDLDGFLGALQEGLRGDFGVPHAALRLWDDPMREGRPEFAQASAALKDYAAGLAVPYCGPSGHVEAAGWFGEAAGQIRSVAHMALRAAPFEAGEPCFGMLALGSEDVLRFYPEMGTLYLERIGQLVSAGLARLL